MNKQVQEYINSKKKELEEIQKEKKQSAKESFLIEEGFCNKVYAPESGEFSKAEYHYSEYDKEKEAYFYYKLVPMDISDEDYESMLSAYNAVEDESDDEDDDDEEEEDIPKNNIAIFMTVVSVSVYIVGLVVGIVLGKNLGHYSHFEWISASICWFAGFVYGSLFLGVSEVIKLLHRQCD